LPEHEIRVAGLYAQAASLEFFLKSGRHCGPSDQ